MQKANYLLRPGLPSRLWLRAHIDILLPTVLTYPARILQGVPRQQTVIKNYVDHTYFSNITTRIWLCAINGQGDRGLGVCSHYHGLQRHSRVQWWPSALVRRERKAYFRMQFLLACNYMTGNSSVAHLRIAPVTPKNRVSQIINGDWRNVPKTGSNPFQPTLLSRFGSVPVQAVHSDDRLHIHNEDI